MKAVTTKKKVIENIVYDVKIKLLILTVKLNLFLKYITLRATILT